MLDFGRCPYCGNPKNHPSAEMCDGCWELETRVRRQPDLAFKFITDSVDSHQLSLVLETYLKLKEVQLNGLQKEG